MARLPRIVVQGLPHLVTQKTSDDQNAFFDRQDYENYLECMRQACRQFGVKILAYCLMPNRTHLVVVPSTSDSLAKAIGRGHDAYTRYINFKMKKKGNLWHGRFSSFAIDESYLQDIISYVEFKPVTAGMVSKPEDYEWSSAHICDRDNFREQPEIQVSTTIEKHERTGRPMGSFDFLN